VKKFARDLVTEGFISQDQLILAKTSEDNLGIDLGHILIARGFIKEEELIQFVARKLAIEYHKPTSEEIDSEIIRIFPFHLAKKHLLLPLGKNPQGKVVVVMADPSDPSAQEDLRAYYPEGFVKKLGTPHEILQLLEKHHKQSSGLEGTRVILELATSEDVQSDVETKKIQEIASGPKIIATVNNIIAGAKKEGASDIHIEPYRDSVRVRYRIDGVLRERAVLSKSMDMPVVSRIKIMAQLDIAERRVPQDGRARVKLVGRPLDLRISICPTQFGEKVVMRLFAKDNIKTIESLGFNDHDRNQFVNIISKPNGIFLVTGPTGSGKSSTLYAGLMRINSPECNIITIEDPIESEIEGINQVAINPKSGVTFASVLRSALRQDPDIIMLGEIRDGETAEIAVRAALTGHMVLSTLHTNSAAGAVDRLKDIGIEPFMMASALKGILAQRLVRKICQYCREEVSPENEYDLPLKKLFKGKGCQECNFTGFGGGRIGIFELIDVDKDVRKLIRDGGGEAEVQAHTKSQSIATMIEDGIKKCEDGITTIDEVIQATAED
jgi:type IV pilus assembly protein PilB